MSGRINLKNNRDNDHCVEQTLKCESCKPNIESKRVPIYMKKTVVSMEVCRRSSQIGTQGNLGSIYHLYRIKAESAGLSKASRGKSWHVIAFFDHSLSL